MLLRRFLIPFCLLVLQACSHPLEIVGGGDIVSASGERGCTLEQYLASDTRCTDNLVVNAYSETYSAVPREGWEFTRWDGCGPQFPNCSFNIPAETVRNYWGNTVGPLTAVFEPLPGSELDSDADGALDVDDAYPFDAFCSIEAEGNGRNCYGSLANSGQLMETFTGADGRVYMLVETALDVLLLGMDPVTQRFVSEIEVTRPNGQNPQAMAYHPGQNRVYLAYLNGVVRYVDMVAPDSLRGYVRMDGEVTNLAAVGLYLMVQTYREQDYSDYHNVLSIDGTILDSGRGEAAETYLWNPPDGRLYYRERRWPNNLRYDTISQLNGQLSPGLESPYRYEYDMRAPLLMLPGGGELLLGSGHVFSASDLTHVEARYPDFDEGYSDDAGLVVLAATGDEQTRAYAYDAGGDLIQIAIFDGAPEAVTAAAGGYLLVTRGGSTRHYHYFTPDADIDDDGVPNTDDAFPEDPAASVDSDRDGYPDQWNTGVDPLNPGSSLVLDAYPDDSACQLPAHGSGDVCDIQTQVNPQIIDQVRERDGVIYLLSRAEERLYRWDTASQGYLNPVFLAPGEAQRSPLSAEKLADDRVLVGYDSGDLVEVSITLPMSDRVVQRFDHPVRDLVDVDDYTLVSTGSLESYDPGQMHLLDSGYQRTDTEFGPTEFPVFDYNRPGDRIYWASREAFANVGSHRIDRENGTLEDRQSPYSTGAAGTTFVSASPAAEQVALSDGEYFWQYGNRRFSALLPVPGAAPGALSLGGVEWLDEIAVAAITESGTSYLALFSTDLGELLFELPPESSQILKMLRSGDDIVILYRDVDGRIQYRIYPLQGDEDEDGLPFWWELLNGLDDGDAGDASLDADSDGLDNLGEYLAGTSAVESDTDGDGLSDGDEANLYGTDPSASDSDGDFLPDDWEIANGLDPLAYGEASKDEDRDGSSTLLEYIYGTDPDSAASVPNSDDPVYYSFEDGELPAEWEVTGGASIIVDSNYASHGLNSVRMEGFHGINWTRMFAPLDLSFDVRNDCAVSSGGRLIVHLDGEEVGEVSAGAEWRTFTLTIAAGEHELSLYAEDYSGCGVRLDAFRVRPLLSLFEAGIGLVTQGITQGTEVLNFIDINGELQRTVEVPPSPQSYDQALSVTILDDGRVAVNNGALLPWLSIYDPLTHLWENIAFDALENFFDFEAVNGIAAFGDRVFLANPGQFSDPGRGIVLVDLTDNSYQRFGAESVTELVRGLDGLLYGMENTELIQYDPQSLLELSRITLPSATSATKAIAVAADGSIFAATRLGRISRLAADGTELDYIEGRGSPRDLVLRPNGELLVSYESFNQWARTTTALDSLEEFLQPGLFAAVIPDTDTDADGMPDWWEIYRGLDPNLAADAAFDDDGDGLSALEEYGQDTDPNLADSDGDGVVDGDEVNLYSSDPLQPDTDGDGLTDGEEVAQGTDVLLVDSDDDSLTDGEEVNVYGSDPLEQDTDNDGMADGYEAQYGLDLLLDDAGDDSDSDGLTNLVESTIGTNPNVADSDGDGLSDSLEYLTYSTDPLSADSDADKMTDDWEVLYGLNPLDAGDAPLDNDLDQYSNLEEFYAGSAPDDANDVPPPTVWATHQGGPDHTGYTPAILDHTRFTERWTVTLPGISQLNPVSAADGKVFVTSDSYFDTQWIYGLDAADGSALWQLSYLDTHSINPPAYANGSVYYQTGGHEDSFLRRVDATTGVLQFRSAYGNQWSRYHAPTPYAGNIYIAGGYYDGTYAFDGTNGNQLWFANHIDGDEFTPAVDNNYVYSFFESLLVYERGTGELAYEIPFPGYNWNGWSAEQSPVLTVNANVVCIQAGTLVVFDTGNRSILWERTTGFSGQPATAVGVVYALDSGALTALDEGTGNTDWIWEAQESLTSNIVVTSNLIFVGSATTTYAIDLNTGQPVWSYPAAGHLSLSDEGVLYIAGTALVAISLDP